MKCGKSVMKNVPFPSETGPLRMPLQGIDGESGVMKRLDHAVFRAYGIDGDAGSGTTRCLVVGTVDRKFRPEEPADPAAICSSARMQQIRSVASPGVAGSGRKMLDQRAAEIDIDDLKTAAKKLDEGDFWETKGSNSGSSDTTAQITSAVKDFANAYNSVLDQSSKVNSTDVKQQTRAMTSLTRTLSKALSNIGINQDTAGKLTVDEDKLKSADKKSVEKLLSGTYSYAAQITKQASNISSAAVRSSSLYTSTGSLTQAAGAGVEAAASQMKTRQKTTAKSAQESTSLTSTGTEAANKLFDDYYASKGE